MNANVDRVEVAHRALRQAIIEQALRPGTKLPEDDLGQHFGMSRTLVRAVLARLQAQGLIDTSHKRTAVVAQPSLEEARDAFEVRKVLEREAVRLLVERWSASIDAALSAHVREEITAFEAGNARVSTRLAGEFHLRIAELSGNSLLQRYLDEVISRCSLILAVYSRPHSAECAVNEHSAILEALRRGDVTAVQDLMGEHLGLVETRALIDETEKQSGLNDVLSRYSPPASKNVPASRRHSRATP